MIKTILLNLLATVFLTAAGFSAQASVVVDRLIEYPTGIDPTRDALLPGQTSSGVNIINSLGGITDILIDFDSLPAAGSIGLADLNFRVGNSQDLFSWAPLGPAPLVTTLFGGGGGGADRLELTWPANSIENTWLEVRIAASADTGLSTADVFYFGHMFGDTDLNGALTPIDAITIINAINAAGGSFAVGADSPLDVDRNGLVSAQDATAVVNALMQGAPPPLVALAPPTASIPLPASGWLLATGVFGVAVCSGRRKRDHRKV